MFQQKQSPAVTALKRGSIPRVNSAQLPAVERQASVVLKEESVDVVSEDPIAQLRKLLDSPADANGVTPELRDAPSVSNSK